MHVKKVEQKNARKTCYIYMLYFLKGWGFKDVKYDIPMCQSHSTRPQFIQLVTTMQKKALYVIISGEIPENWVHKSYWHKIIFDVPVIFHFSQCKPVPGAYFGKNVTQCDTTKMAKNALWKIAEPP